MKHFLLATAIVGSLFIGVDSASATRPIIYQATPCAAEDGPGPCVWDAKHMGNGEGKSYRLRANGDTKYLPHKVAHCKLRPHFKGECRGKSLPGPKHH